MKTTTKYSLEFRERAVRMVFDHQGEHESQWKAIVSIATKIGCAGETLRKWVRQAERDQGKRPGLSNSERDRLKELERENRELKRANENKWPICVRIGVMSHARASIHAAAQPSDRFWSPCARANNMRVAPRSSKRAPLRRMSPDRSRSSRRAAWR